MLAEDLRLLGFELDDDELQTTPRAAARELAGKRVFALVMGAIVPDLEGIELVGDHADAVLLGGCDETTEPNQVFSWMNLGRAFAELQMGAELYCLHKNKWWQTSRGPLLDAAHSWPGSICDGRRRDGPRQAECGLLRGGAGRARGRARADVDGDRDIEGDVRGAQSFGMRTALVRTGKFRPETLETLASSPRSCSARWPSFPTGSSGHLGGGLRQDGTDLIEIERIVRALDDRFRDRCFTQAERSSRDPAGSGREPCGPFLGKEAVGKALGCGVRFHWKDIEIVARRSRV